MKCPNCGANNRPNAKFCAQCRAPLAPATTMKVCPQCREQNRMGAKFCGHCGHTFETPAAVGARQVGERPDVAKGSSIRPASPLQNRNVYAAAATIVGLVIIVGLLAGRRGPSSSDTASTTLTAAPIAAPSSDTPSSSPGSTPTPYAALDRALLATVQIIVPVDGQRRSSAGSGSVLTEQGHILTNFHVMADPDTGRLYNRRGIIYIAVSPSDLKGPPEVRYIAELMQEDQSLDLALIKIIATQNGRDLPAGLNLTTMPIGDSDTVKIGDELSIIGFPGLGGATVTFTKGSVSGFLTDEGWIKTDAEINPGNSGGAAINGTGQLVGIPSAAAGETIRLPGKIGLVRPVNLARPLIDLAMSDAQAGR